MVVLVGCTVPGVVVVVLGVVAGVVVAVEVVVVVLGVAVVVGGLGVVVVGFDVVVPGAAVSAVPSAGAAPLPVGPELPLHAAAANTTVISPAAAAVRVPALQRIVLTV